MNFIRGDMNKQKRDLVNDEERQNVFVEKTLDYSKRVKYNFIENLIPTAGFVMLWLSEYERV